MLVCLRPVILLLLINFLDLSSSQNATRPRSRPSGGMNEDYDSDYDRTTKPPSSASTNFPELNRCDYDMCVEQQQPCRNITEVKPCLCPGLDDRSIPPKPPRISHLTPQDDKGVVVHWCAPTSTVNHYIVSVKGKDKGMHKDIQVEERKRSTLLQDVAAGALLCVAAVNYAGKSAENGQSCKIYEPQHSDSGLALKLGIIGGVVGLIVLLILALLLWRHKTRQKPTARNETGGIL